MKRFIAVIAIAWAPPALAQVPTAPAPAANVEITGSVTTGVQQVDNDTNSSKLTEYRDLRDAVYLPNVAFSARDQNAGWFFDFRGVNVVRDDQTIFAEGGRPDGWRVTASWLGVPHNYSNKALTPYVQSRPGLFEVPATIPITFKKLATSGAADVPGVLASDELVAAYQRSFLAPTSLGTQTNTGRFAFRLPASDALTLALNYDVRDKSGSKATFGPIGDRPPRTLNIQLAEPIDYRTNDLTFSAEHKGSGYQVQASYLFSDFANGIDTLQWQNVFATAAPGATYDAWDRAVSTYGVRPLPPDNRHHNVSASFGADLPFDGRVTLTGAYGRLEQDQTLLPYSYNSDMIAVGPLPRSSADALIDTVSLAADYAVSPFRRVNVHAFYRRYNLDNETPSSQWRYVTSDTSNMNGSVSYVNKRVSVPYAWDRNELGAEAIWRLRARSSLTFGYERETIGREHREADTAENIVRAAWRTRATRWLSVQARYVEGFRDGGVYDTDVTREGYWYTQAEANDNNNPAVTFDNHPDMRRFDVSDRRRRQVDLTVSLAQADAVALSAYARYRRDNLDADVTPSQPLLETTLADRLATTPGDQLGRLEDRRTRYGADLFVQAGPRAALNAFVTLDQGSALDRSLEFNENNKANPSAVATAELGPWTRAGSQWTADIDDRTWSTGAGATVQVVPDRLTVTADYTVSLANVNVAYSGYGVTNFDGTPFAPNHQFAFSSPPEMRRDLHAANLRLEIPLRGLTLIAGYTYERYVLDDWQEGGFGPWVESVGAGTLLRDSSRSFQWGNRLFNLGTYLAPSYDAHLGFLGLSYRF